MSAAHKTFLTQTLPELEVRTHRRGSEVSASQHTSFPRVLRAGRGQGAALLGGLMKRVYLSMCARCWMGEGLEMNVYICVYEGLLCSLWFKMAHRQVKGSYIILELRGTAIFMAVWCCSVCALPQRRARMPSRRFFSKSRLLRFDSSLKRKSLLCQWAHIGAFNSERLVRMNSMTALLSALMLTVMLWYDRLNRDFISQSVFHLWLQTKNVSEFSSLSWIPVNHQLGGKTWNRLNGHEGTIERTIVVCFMRLVKYLWG